VHASPGAAAAGDNALVAAAVCDAHLVAAAGGTAAVSAGTVVHSADTAAEVQRPAASAPLDVMAVGTTKDEEHDHVVSVSSVEEATAVCWERDESDGCIPSTKVCRESDSSGAAARGLGVHVTCRAKLKPSCSPSHSRGRAQVGSSPGLAFASGQRRTGCADLPRGAHVGHTAHCCDCKISRVLCSTCEEQYQVHDMWTWCAHLK